MKSLKTPLRYPGGKSRACVKMDPYFPDLRNYDEFREPFLGGGSVAIHITKKYPNLDIWVNDLYEPLVNFWQQLQMFGGTNMHKDLTDIKNDLGTVPEKTNTSELNAYYARAEKVFLKAKENLNDGTTSNYQRAIDFWIVNKCSFSGLTESSSFSKQASVANFTLRGIEKFPDYSKIIEKWKITNLSYDQLVSNDSNVFVYADPPYDIKDNLYGNKGNMHKGFDHGRFADEMDSWLCNIMISYNNHPDICARFEEWCQYDYAHTYTMRSTGDYMADQQDRRELILTNYGKFRGACTP